MRFHKSSTSSDIVARGPAAVSMMIASEFWRARAGAEFQADAVRCFWRARELMGVLEMINLPESTGQKLLPYYSECKLNLMFRPEQLTVSGIMAFSSRMAEAFERAAQELAHA